MDKVNAKVSRIAKMGFLLFAVLFVAGTVISILRVNISNSTSGYISSVIFFTGLISIVLAWANHQGWFVKSKKIRHFIASPAIRTLSIVLLIFILASTIFAVMSLYSSPYSPNWGNKSEYENTARVLGFASILFGLLLSGLEQNVYWISRIKSLNLDERQIKERQQVFELSYKLYVVILLLVTWFFAGSIISNLKMFIANNAATNPGMLIWLPVNAVVLGFSMPLIVAAWQKR
jgi:hypothetical protein